MGRRSWLNSHTPQAWRALSLPPFGWRSDRHAADTISPAGQGLSRLARAVGLAALGLSLSAAGHVAGGGPPPEAGSLAILLTLLVPGCLLVTRHRVSPMRATAALVALQVLVHQALTLASPPTRPGLPGGAQPPSPHQGHSPYGADLSGSHVHVEAPLGTAHPPAGEVIDHAILLGHVGDVDLRMVLAHAVAAALVGWGVGVVDRVLFLLVDLLARPLALLGAVPLAADWGRCPLAVQAPVLRSGRSPVAGLARGPPTGHPLAVSSADRSRLAAV